MLLAIDEIKEAIQIYLDKGYEPGEISVAFGAMYCDNEIDYNELIRNLGLEGKKVRVAKRRMKARAIWYKDMKCQIVPKKEGENNGKGK